MKETNKNMQDRPSSPLPLRVTTCSHAAPSAVGGRQPGSSRTRAPKTNSSAQTRVEETQGQHGNGGLENKGHDVVGNEYGLRACHHLSPLISAMGRIRDGKKGEGGSWHESVFSVSFLNLH